MANNIKDFMNRTGQPAPVPAGINIDLNALPDVCCIKCGEKEFTPIVKIKEMSKTISPNGQEGTININMLRCTNKKCNWLFNAKEYGDWKTAQDGKTMAVKETPSFGDDVQIKILKEDEKENNRILCRQCGYMYDKNIKHTCKGI